MERCPVGWRPSGAKVDDPRQSRIWRHVGRPKIRLCQTSRANGLPRRPSVVIVVTDDAFDLPLDFLSTSVAPGASGRHVRRQVP
jgi:hypothetical protein